MNEDDNFNKLKKGAIIQVTSELGPGSMTGCDAFVQGWVTDEDGHKSIVSFDYFSVTKI
ncbi:MAG: hypothetical protein QN632_08655 [Nitrososphaeraceae archaeon]|nr:hypothetical protein [Nitrososphaeraceae archaeon]